MSPTPTYSPPASPHHENAPRKRRESKQAISSSSRRPSRRLSFHHGEAPDASPRHTGTNRQDTLESQDSQTSQQSHRSAHRNRRASDADRNKSRAVKRVSTMSLPEFRRRCPSLYWPAKGAKGSLVSLSKVAENPDGEKENRGFLDQTSKSQIWSMVLMKHDGKEEHVALKLVHCEDKVGTDEFEKKYNQEYKMLAGLKHNHIIATIGSFVEGSPEDLKYGLLLFPLAPFNLADILYAVSKNNEKRFLNAAAWRKDERAGDLLNYFACLCRAVIYLHSQEQPCRHNDIKRENVLIDKHKTVLLADFDIAKRYTSRLMASTSSRSMYTDEFAPQTVKDGQERSFDWDIFSLACVFLEMATVAFGETTKRMKSHMSGGIQGLSCDFASAKQSGTLLSWIQHLKDVAELTPEVLPIERFQDHDDMSKLRSNKPIAEFFDIISIMLEVKLGDDHLKILNTAWQCFSRFASRDCPDCHPKVCLRFDAKGTKPCSPIDLYQETTYGNVPDRRASLMLPTFPPKGLAKLTTIDSISEASSEGSARDGQAAQASQSHDSQHVLVVNNIDMHHDAVLAFNSQSPGVTMDDSNTPVALQLDEDIINPTTQSEPRPPAMEIATSLNPGRSLSAPEIRFPPTQDDDQPHRHADNLSLRLKIIGEAAHASADSSISATKPDMLTEKSQDTNTRRSPFVAQRRPGTQTPDSQTSEQSHVVADNDRQLVVWQPLEPIDYAGWVLGAGRPIRPNCVRVLTFTPRERVGVSYRAPHAIQDTRLLIYENEGLTVARAPVKITQKFLNGAFFDVPASCKVKYRIPTPWGADGDLLDLRDVLSYRDRWSCFIGMPRIRLMYVPGEYSDAVLEQCVHSL